MQFPIQNIESFHNYTYQQSQFGYVLYHFTFSALALFAVCMVLWMLFVIFRKRTLSLVIVSLLLGTETVLYYRIPEQSIFKILKQINVMRLLNINETLSQYANKGMGKLVISESNILISVMLFLSAAAGAIAIFGMIWMKPCRGSTRIGGIADFAGKISEAYQHLLTKLPVSCKEFHKLLVTARGIVPVLLLLLITLYFANHAKIAFSETIQEKEALYLEQGGADYTEIIKMIEERLADLEQANQALKEVTERFKAGEATQEEARSALMFQQICSTRVNMIWEFIEKQAYLSEIKEQYKIDGYMISDRGYAHLFGEYSYFREIVLFAALAVAIVIIVMQSNRIERNTGMRDLVYASVNGRAWINTRRFAAGLVLTVLLFGMVYGIDMLVLAAHYGFPYLDAPVMSLTFMRGFLPNMSIGMFLFLSLLAKFAATLGIYLAAYGLSIRGGGKGKA